MNNIEYNVGVLNLFYGDSIDIMLKNIKFSLAKCSKLHIILNVSYVDSGNCKAIEELIKNNFKENIDKIDLHIYHSLKSKYEINETDLATASCEINKMINEPVDARFVHLDFKEVVEYFNKNYTDAFVVYLYDD